LSEVKRLLDETVVEVLPLKDARRVARSNEPDNEVIDVSVLAELDRIYRDPDELRTLVLAYEQEGQDVLRRLAAACNTRNHAAFCEIVHALKSNAANVGARQLMENCRAAGAVSMVEFIRERNQLLHELERAFVESVSVLHSISAAASDGASG
jgi:HPt (histidine-containing phosphotransfer) domain-containing protein